MNSNTDELLETIRAKAALRYRSEMRQQETSIQVADAMEDLRAAAYDVQSWLEVYIYLFRCTPTAHTAETIYQEMQTRLRAQRIG